MIFYFIFFKTVDCVITGNYRVTREAIDAERNLHLVPEYFLLLPPQCRHLEGTVNQFFFLSSFSLLFFHLFFIIRNYLKSFLIIIAKIWGGQGFRCLVLTGALKNKKAQSQEFSLFFSICGLSQCHCFASKFENKIKNQNPIDMCKIERGAPQPVAA